MCPACLASALMIAGSVVSTGGFATIAWKKFVAKNAANQNPARTASKEDCHG